MGYVILCLKTALLSLGCRLGPKQSLYKMCSLGCTEGWCLVLFSLSKKKQSLGKSSEGFAAAQNVTAICREGTLSAGHGSCNPPHGPHGTLLHGDPPHGPHGTQPVEV